ncbi:hypothetical protein JS578_07435 [Dysgonomonadaceae bacterium zrk40]|nr:hypothetical protein JS578_07435 [Dysgonomonadaceae bacterium zrk40]
MYETETGPIVCPNCNNDDRLFYQKKMNWDDSIGIISFNYSSMLGFLAKYLK